MRDFGILQPDVLATIGSAGNASGPDPLGMVLRAIPVSILAVLATMFAVGNQGPWLGTIATMLAWSVAQWLLDRSGRRELALLALVAGLSVFAGVACATYGSVRGPASALTVASVAAAGIFLRLPWVLGAIALNLGVVAALIAAEAAGLIRTSDIRPSPVTWLVYAGVCGILGFAAYHMRSTMRARLERQMAAEAARARAQEDARRSSEALETVFRMVPVALTLSRLSDARVIEANPANAAHLGYTREEMLALDDVRATWADPEDYARLAREVDYARLARAVDGRGPTATIEARQRTRAGDLVDVQAWAARVDVAGEPCLLVAAINVTDRKRDEALLYRLAEGVAGATGQPLFASLVEHLADVLGCEIAFCGEVTGRGAVRALALRKDGAMARDATLDLAGTPDAHLPFDGSPSLTPDGVLAAWPGAVALDPRVRGHAGMLLRDDDGGAIGLLSAYAYHPLAWSPRAEALFRIFAARAEAELRHLRRDRELQDLRRSLELRVRERTQDLETFSYSVSHDLRAPLRAVSGMSSILRQDFGATLAPAAIGYLDRIDHNALKMGRLVDGLIEFARLGLAPLEPREVEMRPLVERAASGLDAFADGRVELRIGTLHPAVGEPRMLALAWHHLLDNAAKFSASIGHPCVHVNSERLPDGWVRYSVADNGVGFDPAYAHKIFGVFERLHDEARFEGTGIGLALVRRIVLRHGGTTEARGEPGRGATLSFILPPAQAGGSTIAVSSRLPHSPHDET